MEKDFIWNVFCRCKLWLRVEVLAFLFLARLRFKSESISSIVQRRYNGEILKAIRKFEKADY